MKFNPAGQGKEKTSKQDYAILVPIQNATRKTYLILLELEFSLNYDELMH